MGNVEMRNGFFLVILSAAKYPIGMLQRLWFVK
jgi:hypothetical protein